MHGPQKTLRPFGAIFVLPFAVAAAIYLPYVDAFYVADDYLFLFGRDSEPAWFYLVHPVPACAQFRPLQAFVLATLQSSFGSENTVPVHLAQMGLHAALAWLVGLFCVRSGSSLAQGCLAGLIVVTSPSAVLAVLGVDGLSQQTVVLFGLLALWAWRHAVSRPDRSATFYAAALAALVLALWSKESAVGFALAIVVLTAVRFVRRPGSWRWSLPRLLPVLAIGLVYVAYRSGLDLTRISFGPERYEMHLGWNIPLNVLRLIVGTTVPVSTVWLHQIVQGDRAWLGYTVVAATGLALVWLTLRFPPFRSARRTWEFAGTSLAVVVPFVLFNHVSELYTYSLLPFYGIAFACSTGRGLAGRRRWTRVVLIVLVAGILGAQTLSTVRKAARLHANGETSRSLFRALEPHVVHAPRDASLVLCDPASGTERYSAFRMATLDTLALASRGICEYYGRPDVHLNVSRDCGRESHRGGPRRQMFLWLDEGALRRREAHVFKEGDPAP